MLLARRTPVAAAAAWLLTGAACQMPPRAADRNTTPCAETAGHAGCAFRFADTDNTNLDDAAPVALFVASAGARASVLVDQRQAPGWVRVAEAEIAADDAAWLLLLDAAGRPIDGAFEGEGHGPGGFRLTASTPVWVLLMNPSPLGGAARSVASSLLLPDVAAGRSHVLATSSAAAAGGQAVAVATTPTRGTLRTASRTVTFALEEGEVAAWAGADLDGAVIDSDAPLPVLGGAVCAPAVGADASLVIACDKTEEALPDTAALAGRAFAVPPLPERADVCGARPGAPSGTRVRITALEGPTHLRLDPADADATVPSEADISEARGTLTVLTQAGLFVSADRPVTVTATSVCEPALALIPPYERWSDSSTLLAPSPVRETAVIVRKANTDVALDGVPMLPTSFRPLGGGFEAATVTLPDCGLAAFGRPPRSLARCVHHLTGARAMTLIAGQDLTAAYAHTGTWAIAPL